MEAILPFKIKNEQKFFESALKVGFNEMEILKFVYVMQQSDLDIFPKMHDERINVLLYGWELCEDYKQKLNPNEWELPEELETTLKLLVAWSMDIWFSKEWDKCKYLLKTALIHCLNRARDLLMRMPDMMQINWDFLLLYNFKPWNVLYLKNLTVTKEKTLENGAQSIEMEELPANDEDIAYVKLEQLPIIVLRLIKLFDQSSIDMVKTLCMRVIAAWNKIHQTELETSASRRPYVPPEDKRCLMLICHIYLMAVYESDDVKGYVIDNMINNIRFYYQGFHNSTSFHAMDNFEYTPARYIALTNFHLRVQKRDFFDFFIWNKYDTSLVNLFGVVAQAYKSYLLGNLLMELNNMNEDDFASNIPLYKRLMNSYVNEREKSELFLLNELDKIEAQRYAHNVIQTVQNVTDFKSKICKGNRMSNIGNYENSDDTVAPLVDIKTENNTEIKEEETKEEVIDEDVDVEQQRVKESELRLDPVFQNLPNNESMLYYVYDVLAKKDYKGWHFAKVVLLVKIIGREQNMIETWRYHPGLTTDFMLNLETKLSHHYVDLAKIFKDHPFLEQEFWLTAFYLNPTTDLYEIIKRLGMRNNRKRTDEHTKLVMSIDNIDAKYGLLSSTIDVKELATMSNTDDPVTDYDPLFAALHSLRVPDSLIKDMLTAIFLPRNRSFAWAIDWVVLRNRCKIIMTSSKEKKRFVDLNMAEANERLKFLIIDYEKYKNRPQLDYGSIEQGYESLMSGGDFDKDSEEDEEDEEEEDFEDDEDVYESKRRGRGRLSAVERKKEEEKPEDDNSQEDDPFLMGKRRTRARTAATLASFLFQTLPRSSRRKKNEKPSEEETKPEEEKISGEIDEKSSDSKSPIATCETSTSPPVTGSYDQKDNPVRKVPTKNLKESLKKRPAIQNTTQGFENLIDIWNVEETDLQSIDENCVSLMESTRALQIAVKLKLLNKEINPMGCDETEYIDDTEMIIHNSEYAIKRECDINAVEEEALLYAIQESKAIRSNVVPMEVDDYQENVETVRNVVANVEELIKADLKLSEEFVVEKETKQGTAGTDPSEKTTQPEENIIENISSDLSTTAGKDNDEVSESNPEPNSELSTLNIGVEMNDQIIQNNDSNNETGTKSDRKVNVETELKITHEDKKSYSELNQKNYIVQEKTCDENETSEENNIENNTEERRETEEGNIAEETEVGNEVELEKYARGNMDNESCSKEIVDEKLKTVKNADEKKTTEDENKSDVDVEMKKEIEIGKENIADKEIHLNEVNQAEEENKADEENKVEKENVLEENISQEENAAEESKPQKENKAENENEVLDEKKAGKHDETKIEIESEGENNQLEKNKSDKDNQLNEAQEENKSKMEIETEEERKAEDRRPDDASSNQRLQDGNATFVDMEVEKANEVEGESGAGEDKKAHEENEAEKEQIVEEFNTKEEKRKQKQKEHKADKENKTEEEYEVAEKNEMGGQNEEAVAEEYKTDETDHLSNEIEAEKQPVKQNDARNKDISTKNEEQPIFNEHIAKVSEISTKFENKTTRDGEIFEEPVKDLKELKDHTVEANHFEIDGNYSLNILNRIEETENHSTELRECLDEKASLNAPLSDENKIEKETIEGEDTETCPNTLDKSYKSKDLVESNNLGPEQSDHTIHKEEEPGLNKDNASDTKDYLFQSQNNESDFTLHFSTSDELNLTSETINQAKHGSIEDEKLTEAKVGEEKPNCKQTVNDSDDQTKLKTDDCEKVTHESIDHRKSNITDWEEAIAESSDSRNLEPIDFEELIEAYCDQAKSETINCVEASSEENKLKTSDCEELSYAGNNTEIIHCNDALDAPIDESNLETIDSKNFENVLSNQALFEANEAEKVSKIPFLLFDDSTADSIETTYNTESSDGETQNLKKLCLMQNVKVILHKLRSSDLKNLRQPKVKIKRMNFETYLQEPRPKRKCLEGRVYLEFDESSNSTNSFGTNTSSSEAYRPPRIKGKIPVRRHSLRQLRTSDSENDSNNSDDLKLSTIMARKRKSRLSPPSTSQSSLSQHFTGPKSVRKTGPKSARKTGPKSARKTGLKSARKTGPKSARRTGPKSTRKTGPKSARKTGPKSKRQSAGPKSSKQNLVVTPRSASGLKLRISNAERNRQVTGPMSGRPRGAVCEEVIQLSSSSSDEYLWNELTAIEEENVMEIEEYALFEEEIII